MMFRITRPLFGMIPNAFSNACVTRWHAGLARRRRSAVICIVDGIAPDQNLLETPVQRAFHPGIHNFLVLNIGFNLQMTLDAGQGINHNRFADSFHARSPPLIDW
jgi:hypothetical protein